jgi:hypothetical protein
MNLKIDYEIVDEIVRQSMLETYVSLIESIKKADKKTDSDDIILWTKTVSAIEELADWYFFDFKRDLEKYKKENKK